MAKRLVNWPGGLIGVRRARRGDARSSRPGAAAGGVAEVAAADVISVTVLNDEQVRAVSASWRRWPPGTVIAIHSTISGHRPSNSRNSLPPKAFT
jgi:3-hydroxyisobutyrate dehydrogenase-like beta-hydroxyacid dehydrogenase